uniref:Uncharacterized protein LOC114334139 isoform X1 n=1 Tax=Diabrotica virgifera virgifera TaxID=50390 RepID=A0A6P7FU45_DIAVI
MDLKLINLKHYKMRVFIFVSFLLLFNMANGLARSQQGEHLHLNESARLLDGHQKPYNVETQKVTKSGVTLRSNFFETLDLTFNYGVLIYTKPWRTTQPPTTETTVDYYKNMNWYRKAFEFHVLNIPDPLNFETTPTTPTTPTTTTTTTYVSAAS